MSDLAIQTEGLTKHYRGLLWRRNPTPALEDLNLEVSKGVVFGFLGPNGAGKTTTIRCLMDLIRPTAGRAWVLGSPSSYVPIRARIGYLPDSPSFSPHLTAWQFLSLCARLLKIPSGQRRLRIDEVLKSVEMLDAAHQQLKEFSRGMLQRIGIAQALLNKPDLLVLDEPLVGLDPHGRKDLLEIVRAEKRRGTCIFFCSHILSDVEKLCDQVGILNHGRLLVAGPLDQVLASRGLEIHIPPGEETLAKDLMVRASETHREPDGAWRLVFVDEAECRQLQERPLPDTVIMKARKEGLEELFFRLTRQET